MASALLVAPASIRGNPSSSPSIRPAAPLGPKAPKEPQALPAARPPADKPSQQSATPAVPATPVAARPPADKPSQQSATPAALSKLQASPRTVNNPLFNHRITSII
jgi:hypothetical protein